jgi:hypothetical protein
MSLPHRKSRNPASPTPESPAPAGASEMQKMLDGAVTGELLGTRPTIMGREIRPVTLASIALLKQAKSPLIEGVAIKDIQNVLLECCVFMFLQTSSLAEATSYVFGPYNELVLKALEFADTIPPEDVGGAVNQIIVAIRDATSTQVRAKSKHDDGGGTPRGNE